ncbi:hypothetical protein Pcinc_003496 [Petrolisthes cinctipes]|uniref:Uncharacterized protein n=1 Tax=Petrolisthes cinctipes TaxID=88211 RepID=A0AAE1L1A7_PETCI|nr:hypothetical protein Pcinc_003496 [Petrolisthes cinctipes]
MVVFCGSESNTILSCDDEPSLFSGEGSNVSEDSVVITLPGLEDYDYDIAYRPCKFQTSTYKLSCLMNNTLFNEPAATAIANVMLQHVFLYSPYSRPPTAQKKTKYACCSPCAYPMPPLITEKEPRETSISVLRPASSWVTQNAKMLPGHVVASHQRLREIVIMAYHHDKAHNVTLAIITIPHSSSAMPHSITAARHVKRQP